MIEHLWVTGYTPRPSHRGIQKTALGSQHTVPWSEAEDANSVIRRQRDLGYSIAVLEITDDPTPIQDVDIESFPLVLVVGNELEGVSDEAIAAADFAIEIPQYGAKQSLNVAVAFGVAAYGLVERWNEV